LHGLTRFCSRLDADAQRWCGAQAHRVRDPWSNGAIRARRSARPHIQRAPPRLTAASTSA